MQAGGVFLQPTLALLRAEEAAQAGRARPGTSRSSPTTASREELDAIRAGKIDATVSQPADLYAKYALYYAKAALEGKTFKPGPTDHDSTIVKIPNGLEDQLPAPLVTKDNVDDPKLWANQLGEVELTMRARGRSSPPRCRREGIVKRFGPTVALDGVRLTVAARRVARAGRPQRRGQVHAGVRPHRPARARTRARSPSAASPRPPLGDTARLAAPGRLRLPEVHGGPAI